MRRCRSAIPLRDVGLLHRAARPGAAASRAAPAAASSASLCASMALGGFAALLVCCLCYTLLCAGRAHVAHEREVSRGTRSRDYGGSKLETHLPRTRWPLGKRYACFLSHSRRRPAATRSTSTILQRVLGVPVFLDSVDLSNLTLLFTEGVHQSDVLVLSRRARSSRGRGACSRSTRRWRREYPSSSSSPAAASMGARARPPRAPRGRASALDEIREHVGDIEPFSGVDGGGGLRGADRRRRRASRGTRCRCQRRLEAPPLVHVDPPLR